MRSFVVALLAASALATPYKRFSGLTVDFTGPGASVNAVDELSFTVSVSNTGTEDVKVLKYGTVLDSLPTRSFAVTKGDEEVSFTGVKMSVQLSDSAYTTIPAGETVTVTHDVSALFDFASAGTGTFTFVPNTNFQVAGSDETVAAVSELTKVAVSSPSISVEVKSDVSKRGMRINKRATDICTTASRKTFIDASYTEGKQLASIASSYIASTGASQSYYVSYWGSSSTSTVRGVLNNVANENSSSRTLSCTDTYGVCDGNVIAYTVISTTNIYYCSIFFNEVPSTSLCSGTTVAARNVRGGTTLHELTHATSGTDDVTYGCSADIALSDANAVRNADNYNCYATQIYQSTQC